MMGASSLDAAGGGVPQFPSVALSYPAEPSFTVVPTHVWRGLTLRPHDPPRCPVMFGFSAHFVHLAGHWVPIGLQQPTFTMLAEREGWLKSGALQGDIGRWWMLYRELSALAQTTEAHRNVSPAHAAAAQEEVGGGEQEEGKHGYEFPALAGFHANVQASPGDWFYEGHTQHSFGTGYSPPNLHAQSNSDPPMLPPFPTASEDSQSVSDSPSGQGQSNIASRVAASAVAAALKKRKEKDGGDNPDKRQRTN